MMYLRYALMNFGAGEGTCSPDLFSSEQAHTLLPKLTKGPTTCWGLIVTPSPLKEQESDLNTVDCTAVGGRSSSSSRGYKNPPVDLAARGELFLDYGLTSRGWLVLD